MMVHKCRNVDANLSKSRLSTGSMYSRFKNIVAKQDERRNEAKFDV